MRSTQQAQAPTAQSQAAANYNYNMQVRNWWVYGQPSYAIPPALNMKQQVNPSLPASVLPGSVLIANMRNVGLVKRLTIELKGTITAGAVSTQTLQAQGLSNLISNVQYYDLANNTRVNTSGWHLTYIASVKRRRPWGAAATTDTGFGFGNNFSINTAPATITANNNTTFTALFEVPFVRMDNDLRGAIFGDITTGNAQLQVTLNPGMFVASGVDGTLAVYKSAGADLATLSNVTWQVYQNYLENGPRQQDGTPVLPALDIGTAYMLTNTNSPGSPVVNADNTAPFVNQRQFLSLIAIYDNAGVLNAGTDISSMKVQSANLTNVQVVDPFYQALEGRLAIGDDFPKGVYYFDFNDRPIDTVQFGNYVFALVPSSVGGSTATILYGWEAYGRIGLVNQGGSIPSGA